MTAVAEMPEDVMRAAREAAATVWAGVGGEALAAEFRSGMRDDSGSVESAAAAILAERERDRWQPIETVPRNEEVVLGWFDMDGDWIIEVGEGSWGWRNETANNMSFHGSATHWQPLPSAPKGGD